MSSVLPHRAIARKRRCHCFYPAKSDRSAESEWLWLSVQWSDDSGIVFGIWQSPKKRYVSPFYLAMVYSGLGRMDEAFRLLDQALEQQQVRLPPGTPNPYS
jgi:hypothetical protein